MSHSNLKSGSQPKADYRFLYCFSIVTVNTAEMANRCPTMNRGSGRHGAGMKLDETQGEESAEWKASYFFISHSDLQSFHKARSRYHLSEELRSIRLYHFFRLSGLDEGQKWRGRRRLSEFWRSHHQDDVMLFITRLRLGWDSREMTRYVRYAAVSWQLVAYTGASCSQNHIEQLL